MKRTRSNSHRGYVLVMTLAALVLVATVMGTLARGAIDHSREARRAESDLQRRWGIISCRRAVLPVADRVLAYQEAVLHRPVASHRTVVLLGGYRFHMVIGDEQARANVNAVLSDTDRANAEARIGRAMGSGGLSGYLSRVIRLRPALPTQDRVTEGDPAGGDLVGSAGRVVRVPVITGWGQVLDASQPEKIVSISGAPCVADLLTCWGDGRINISRASAASIALAAPKLLQTDIQRLIATRTVMMTPGKSSDPAQTVSADPLYRLLNAAQIDPERAAGLSIDSACYSVWICSDDGRRVWYDLAVRDTSDPDRPRVRCFAW